MSSARGFLSWFSLTKETCGFHSYAFSLSRCCPSFQHRRLGLKPKISLMSQKPHSRCYRPQLPPAFGRPPQVSRKKGASWAYNFCTTLPNWVSGGEPPGPQVWMAPCYLGKEQLGPFRNKALGTLFLHQICGGGGFWSRGPWRPLTPVFPPCRKTGGDLCSATSGSRFILTWIIRNPRWFEVLQKSYLSNANLPSKLEVLGSIVLRLASPRKILSENFFEHSGWHKTSRNAWKSESGKIFLKVKKKIWMKKNFGWKKIYMKTNFGWKNILDEKNFR